MKLTKNWKKLHKSYSILLATALSVLSILQANLPVLAAVISPTVFSYITFGLGVLIMIGRYIQQDKLEGENVQSDSK